MSQKAEKPPDPAHEAKLAARREKHGARVWAANPRTQELVAGAKGSWRPEAAPKNTARRVCATCWRMRHAERARKPSSFLKSVHYNKSYASETPMQSIEFTAICSYI